MRTLSATQVIVLREIGSHAQSQEVRSLKQFVHHTVRVRMTVSALARRGLVQEAGGFVRITPKGKALILRNL